MLADSHVHLDGYKVEELREVMAQAREAGVQAVVAVGMDLKSSAETVHLSHSHDAIWPAVGIHPWNAIEVDVATYQGLKAMASQPDVVALSEVGLDFLREGIPSRDIQGLCFSQMMRLAREVRRPLLLHCREAHQEMMAALKAGADLGLGGCIHGFSGDGAMLRDWLDLGYYVSLGRSILGHEPPLEAEVVRAIPLGRLLLETDSSPRARPGVGRITPASVRQVAEKVASLRGTTLEELARATTENLKRLLKKGRGSVGGRASARAT